MTWFDVDKQGLAAMLGRRKKSFVIFELVQNAWDAGASNVAINLEALGRPQAELSVEDDSPEGWADLADAFTMFKRSRRGGDADKRGRFCLGEKLVLALCHSATISTMQGTVTFDEGGRRNSQRKTNIGTTFAATIKMTRAEISECEQDAHRLIPPALCSTKFNGFRIMASKFIKTFETKLPTEIQEADGTLRRSVRVATVEAYELIPGDDTGEILEMGIPVCQADFPWRLNVLQKVPLGMDRDAVTDAFRRALQVAAVNALAETITPDEAVKPWASEAIGDARVQPEALKRVVTQRFGDKAVIAVPGDPMANATAEAQGCVVIHGGSLSADTWANMRKHSIVPTTSQAFPQPKPSFAGEAVKTCPLCKQPVA